MTGGNDSRYDAAGPANATPGSFAVSIWTTIAVFALVFAALAWIYGGGAPSDGRAVATVADPMATGSLPPRRIDDGSVGGRSDIAATTRPSDALAAAEIARLKVENVALRQSIDQLRGQFDRVTERLDGLDARLSEMTGSITPGSAVNRAQTFFETPDVPPKATASAEPSDLPAAASTANTRFGIELGTFTDLNSVKNAWRKLSQDHAALFASLDPVATVRDRSGRTELLLVAGPFKSAADASEHCGKVEAAGLICQPAFYLGQPLAMR